MVSACATCAACIGFERKRMSRMEGGVAIKANEAGHEQSDLRLYGSSVPCMNLLVSCYSGGVGHARQRHFFSYACDDCFIGCFLSFLVFFLVSHATVLLSGSKAVQCSAVQCSAVQLK